MGAIERGELGKRVQVPTNSGRISELEITNNPRGRTGQSWHPCMRGKLLVDRGETAGGALRQARRRLQWANGRWATRLGSLCRHCMASSFTLAERSVR